MENLNLQKIDFNTPSNFNINTYSYWSIKSQVNRDYVTIASAFTKDEVKDIIKLGKSFKFDQSKTADGNSFSDVRKSYNSWIPPSTITEKLYDKISKLILNVNENFFDFNLISLEHLQYTEYDEEYNGEYKMHVDMFRDPPTPNNHRKLSFSIQLTDPETYEGGELVFYSSNETQIADKSIGSITFFPSYILHQVKPVTKGCRNCLVGWVSGPKFR